MLPRLTQPPITLKSKRKRLILLSQAEQRQKEHEELCQERQRYEEDKQRQRAKRHAEKLAVASGLVDMLCSLTSTSTPAALAENIVSITVT